MGLRHEGSGFPRITSMGSFRSRHERRAHVTPGPDTRLGASAYGGVWSPGREVVGSISSQSDHSSDRAAITADNGFRRATLQGQGRKGSHGLRSARAVAPKLSSVVRARQGHAHELGVPALIP